MLENRRHELFALGIAQGKPASTAYINAGYKARGNTAEAAASRLLRNDKVKSRLEQLAAQLAKPQIATADEVQQFLTLVMRGEVTEELLTRDGLLVTAVSPVKDRVKAAELLGRAMGVFTTTTGDAGGELDAIARALENPAPLN